MSLTGKRAMRSLIPLCILSFCACQETLLHDLDELRANRVLVALADSGVRAGKAKRGGKWEVRVSSAEVAQALKVLDANRLLRRDLTRATASDSSLIKTREERKIFLERHLAWGIEHTLEAIPSVLEARVHLCMHVDHELRFGEKKPPQSASVLLVHREGRPIDTGQVKLIVAGAAGIAPSLITVVSSPRKKVAVKPSSGAAVKTDQSAAAAQNPNYPVLLLCAVLGLLLLRVLAKRHRPTLSAKPQAGTAGAGGALQPFQDSGHGEEAAHSTQHEQSFNGVQVFEL